MSTSVTYVLPFSISDLKRSSPGGNLHWTDILVAFYTTQNFETCSVLPGLVDIASWCQFDMLTESRVKREGES